MIENDLHECIVFSMEEFDKPSSGDWGMHENCHFF